MDDCKVIKAATNWWIDQMTKRCKEMYPTKVTGNDSNLIIVDDSLKEELFRFKAVLSKAIENYVMQRTYVTLTCCYIPNRELSKLSEKASISKTYFPSHATMEICCGSVKVSLDGQSLHQLPLLYEQL